MSSSKLKASALWAKAVSKSCEQKDGEKGTGANMLKNKMSLHTVATSLLENRRYSDREKELKAKQDELDNVKVKYKQEQEERKKLQLENQRLLSNQNETDLRLGRAQDALEKLRDESRKKTEQGEKLQRTINILEDKIRNLEIRASEVEKAELTLESTRRNLESSIAECRGKDNEIRKITAKSEETEKKLQTSNEKISKLEDRISDLKLQVRQELMKNEHIERDLDMIPHLKDDITDRDKQIKNLEREVEEKTILMMAARKAVRDYKDKLRDIDQNADKVVRLDEELKVARFEVDTLKKLMSGKDSLVLQKCHALNLAKEVIDSLHTSAVDPEKLVHIRQLLERLCDSGGDSARVTENGHVGPNSTSPKSRSRMGQFRPSSSPFVVSTVPSDTNKENIIDVNAPPFSTNNHQNFPPHPARQQVSPNRHHTASVHRSASFEDSSSRTQSARSTFLSSAYSSFSMGSRNKSESWTGSKNAASVDFTFGSAKDRKQKQYSIVRSKRADSDSETESSNQDSQDVLQKLSHQQRVALSLMSAAEKDRLLMQLINIGDRVTITIPQKPPRYGRKKVKPMVYCGLVKYKGNLDKPHADARMYAGVKLDEPTGDCDGIYKGKRYMFTPTNHGKFFKMRDISTILHIKSGSYVPLGKMMVLHMMSKGYNHGDVESSSRDSGNTSPR